ncbi:MAG: SMP-30/gluconolactonase/LRE family protein [Pseudomonadota bacterium]
MRRLHAFGGVLLIVLIAYLLLWPVDVYPVAWQAPRNDGYTGAFERNDRLAELALVQLAGRHGPEDAAVGPDGLIYTTSHSGDILKIDVDNSVSVFAKTGGRPLGLEFAKDGMLFVADAHRGLLGIDRAGHVEVLADRTVDGSPILYADDVDIASDGTVYFSDASMRFGALASGGTLEGSVRDLMEHSASGRVLKYDRKTKQTTEFAAGLAFANGVAVSEDDAAILVAETGNYRVWRFPIDGTPGVVVLRDLPGFPDNINPAHDGTFWVGLVSPRNALMDRLSDVPFARRIIMRLPGFFRPAPTRYGCVVRIRANGEVIETLQSPTGDFAMTTGAITLPDGRVLVTSLTEPTLGILPPR